MVWGRCWNHTAKQFQTQTCHLFPWQSPALNTDWKTALILSRTVSVLTTEIPQQCFCFIFLSLTLGIWDSRGRLKWVVWAKCDSNVTETLTYMRQPRTLIELLSKWVPQISQCQLPRAVTPCDPVITFSSALCILSIFQVFHQQLCSDHMMTLRGTVCFS